MKIKQIIFPKNNDLIGKKKPLLVVLSSPYDPEGGAVKIKNAIDVAEDRGYTVLNRSGEKPLNFGDKALNNRLKLAVNKESGLTIWVESHGAPGWLFAGQRDPKEEMQSAINFAEYIHFLEQQVKLTVTNVILNSCYSANEYLSLFNYAYFISPARVLSMLLPERNIIGFRGMNTTAGVKAYQKLPKQEKYQLHTFSLEEAAALFKNGDLIEASKTEIYCDHKYTPDFIFKACFIDEDLEDCYKVVSSKEEIDKLGKSGIYIEPSYGDKQIITIRKHLNKLLDTKSCTTKQESKCTL